MINIEPNPNFSKKPEEPPVREMELLSDEHVIVPLDAPVIGTIEGADGQPKDIVAYISEPTEEQSGQMPGNGPYALAAVKAYGPLPRGILKRTEFTTLLFGGGLTDEDKEQGLSSPEGMYNGKTLQVHVNTGSIANFIYQHTPSALSGGGGADPKQWVVLHELGHGDDHSEYDYEQPPEGMSAFTTVVAFVGRNLIDRPEDPTLYGAMGNRGEKHADRFAGTVSVTDSEIVHPDEARKFSSELNRQRLEELARLETLYPGIVDYLVYKNGQSSRSPIAIGH